MATNNQDAFPEDGETGTEPVVAAPVSAVGATLRDAREKMGCDLPTAADRLRIRQPFLRALEEGRHQDLPGGTYAIGFLRSYAEFLGLDEEEMVRRFKREAADALTGRAELVFPSPVSEGRVPTGAILFVGLIIAAAAYGGWYWLSGRSHSVANLVSPLPGRLSSLLDRPADLTGKTAAAPSPVTAPAVKTPAKTAPAKSVVVATPAKTAPAQPAATASKTPAATNSAAPASKDAAVKTPTVTAPAATKTPATKATATKAAPAATTSATPKPATPAASVTAAKAPAAATAPAAGPSQVVLTAMTGDCWIQVQSKDGQLVLSRLLHKGESYDVPDQSGLTLTVGDAAALQVTVDGKVLPALGGAGQVLHNISLDPKALQTRG